MDSWTRVVSSGLIVAAMMLNGVVRAYGAAPQQGLRRLAVAVYDYAGVDPAMLALAERIASDVYLRAGIKIEWVAPDGFEDTGRFYVNLLSKEMAARFSASNETVGFATAGSLAANAIFDRISEIAHDHRLPCGVMLGYVMAHEIGHLLLPVHSHSESGVMRATMDMRLVAAKKLGFTRDQATLMLKRLHAPPMVSTH
jgi:hypothetical protein